MTERGWLKSAVAALHPCARSPYRVRLLSRLAANAIPVPTNRMLAGSGVLPRGLTMGWDVSLPYNVAEWDPFSGEKNCAVVVRPPSVEKPMRLKKN